MNAAARRSLDPDACVRGRSPDPYEELAECRAVTRAVFFDVDFTLIYPGPTFQGEGYRAFCARHGIDGRSVRFDAAVASASSILDQARTTSTTPRSSSATPRTSSGRWAARRRASTRAPREIYDEWAACQHFELYDDVPAVLRELPRRDPNRPDLELAPLPGFVPGALRARGADRRRRLVLRARLHEATPEHLRGGAAARGVPPAEAVMVGDSLTHDIEGALQRGHAGDVLHRRTVRTATAGSGTRRSRSRGRLHELPPLRCLVAQPALLPSRAEPTAEHPASSRRPGQAAAAEQVQVDVEHRLARVAVVVEDGPDSRRSA